MAFNTDEFTSSQVTWEPGKREIPVPELKQWFPDDEEPILTVRALDGRELAAMRDQESLANKTADLFKALSSASPDDVNARITAALGMNPAEQTAESLRHVYAVEKGIEPPIGRDGAITLFKFQHGVFMRLVQAILELSGEGYNAGKS